MRKNTWNRGRAHRIFAAGLGALIAVTTLSCCGGQKDKSDVATTSLQPDQQTGGESTGESTDSAGTANTWTGSDEIPEGALTVVASPGVHEDILKMAQVILAEEGIELYIDSDFDDYLIPNFFVDGGVYDCNYFQHEEYLNTFNQEQGTDLVSVGKIHFEPLGIYPGKKKSLSALEEGDLITIPRDTANQARAIKLLSDAGIVTIPEDKKNSSSVGDIIDNPHGIDIRLMDASQVPSAVASSAFVVMNGNYARQALYTVTSDALAYENPDSSVAGRYANIIAVNRGNENDPRVQALVRVLQSQEIRDYIETRFAGAVVPYTGS